MARKLAVNVAVDQVMYGPDYPQNGDLPEGAKVGDHAFEGSDESDEAPARKVTHRTK